MNNCVRETNKIMFGWILKIPIPTLKLIVYFTIVSLIIIAEVYLG